MLGPCELWGFKRLWGWVWWGRRTWLGVFILLVGDV